ncbi:MAG TPA: hypothetical protein VJJ23_04080 [Candidatus Nanoarchaeia archaeon]|nr:hypothetical protein [Candidatus Nanoarchaeia archaeon]
MKKVIVGLVALLLVMTAIPVRSNEVGSGVGININTEKFVPMIWMCDDRIVRDDCNEPGRVSDCGDKLVERLNNYAFEGESIHWRVLVLDKNGIEKIKDVFVTLGSSRAPENDIEANCKLDYVLDREDKIDKTCNARILEEQLYHLPDNSAAYYDCTLTVETPESMYGEYWVAAEVEDLDGQKAAFDEQEFWFFNPVIALSVDGDIDFGTVRPGTQAYSKTLTVGNNADAGSGVLLDMFISGTDFYDPASSGAKCPDSNVLKLDNFRYFATQGAYSTTGNPGSDSEGYRSIPYEVTGTGGAVNNGRQDIIFNGILPGGYSAGNILSPGAELAITFKLALPEPCNGDFSSGQIMFWGEAI